MEFAGAKLALLVGSRIITLLRDDRPDIPYPGYWDLPGGGREAGESPVACALRETSEELGVLPRAQDILWGRRFTAGPTANWFFVARMEDSIEKCIRLGDEGQCWQMMAQSDFLAHPGVIPQFQERLRMYLEEQVPEKPPAALSGGR
ncbi:NUDIX hydrolase [Roseobacter sp. YSTF-M11]|uniref:NUDIX hydrolase n=2 Tax=Roseobacter insulae TaxID=2859783 RepID=A0A9X1K0G3_9RHOB|nr:NUDIX hydrolase [Roseobacter insulae]